MTSPIRSVSAAVGAALALGCATLPAQAQGYVATVLATGLNAPRGLSFGLDGGLYIAEGGTPGGSGPSTVVRGATFTYVETGSVARWFNGSTTRVVTGLPALWSSAGGEMTGPNDVVFSASGAMSIAIGGGIDPTVRSTDLGPRGAGLQQVVTLGSSANLGSYEAANNPAGGPLDSNPWRLQPAANGAMLATDAGANALLSIAANGSISTLATFASRTVGTTTIEPVPTGIALAANGNAYVGELTGFPFIPGAARIYNVTPGGAVSTFATGFTMLVDLNVAADGTLYALEYDSDGLLNPGTTGALWRVNADGSRTLVYSTGLVQPTAFAIGADGAFYVSNYGNTTGAGQLLRIAPVPEPGSMALLALGLAAVGVVVRRRRA